MNSAADPTGTIQVALAHAERLLTSNSAMALEQATEILKVVPNHPVATAFGGLGAGAAGAVAGLAMGGPLGAVIGGVTGSSDDLIEFVRRLVFMVAVGNEDAHLKNWSLIYRGGRSARLAPAYDLVSTVTYRGLRRGLGLSLARSQRFTDVSRASFAPLAQRVGLDDGEVHAIFRERSARKITCADQTV